MKRAITKPSIGVVGGGVAGCHLALLLQKHGVPASLYAERKPDEVREGRLLNTAQLYGDARILEEELGINFWDGIIDRGMEIGLYGFHYRLYLGDELRSFWGNYEKRGICIDQRVSLPKYLETFADRGGELVYGPLQLDDVERLTEKHDFVVIAAGRGSLAEIFPKKPEYCPYSEPRRLLCSGLYTGVTTPLPHGLLFNFRAGIAEMVEIPMYSLDGPSTAIFFEIVPGSPLAHLVELRYEEDPRQFESGVLEAIERYFPETFEQRIDVDEFGLKRPLDLLQGAIVPATRSAHAHLRNGKFVLAIGDVFALHDPILGLGSNSAIHCAHVAGKAIVNESKSYSFDKRFCEVVEEEMWTTYVRDASIWSNFHLRDPVPGNLTDLFLAASKSQSIADYFTSNFNRPEQNWNVLATPERTQSFLRRYGFESVSGVRGEESGFRSTR